jgi:multidrug efflux pump
VKTLFYRYPRLLVLALALIFVSGASSFMILPRAEDPALSSRVARVLIRLPGADPGRVDALIAEPVEQELLEISELKRIMTTSRAGVSMLLLELKDAVTDVDPVWVRVRAKLNDIEASLPPGASKPEFEEQDIQAFTLITAMRWEGKGDPDLASMGRLARTLRDRLRHVSGTDDVELWGAVPEEVLVDGHPSMLTALGQSTQDLAAQVARGDAKVSAGTIHSGRTDLLLEVTGELDSLERVRAVPVRQAADGRVLRLGDAATVRRGPADPSQELALVSGQPSVVVAARLKGARRVDHWSRDTKEVIDAFRVDLPRDVSLTLIFDQARYTDARLSELLVNLLTGVVLVMLVLLVLMGWRSALLVGLSLPLVTLSVLTGMRALEIPLHQMSVTGLIIALGLLIDNAIVMVDEVENRLRVGASRVEAIGGSVSHLAVPLLGSTLTTMLAFAPMVLMPGPAGEFVGAIAVSVMLALGSSLFLALTVIPTLRALVDATLPSAQAEEGSWLTHGVRSEALRERYEAGLERLLANPVRGAALMAVPALLGFLAAFDLAEQFFPPSDRDQVQIELRLPYQASQEETRAAAEEARRELRRHPQVEDVHWFLGRSSPKFYYNQLAGQDGSSFYAQGLVQLKTSRDVATLVQSLQERLTAALPQAQAVIKLFEQGPPFDAPVELHLYGPDREELRRLGDRARGVLQRVPHVVLTRTTIFTGRPQLTLELDEEQARLHGVTPTEVAGQLDAALSGARGGSVLEGTEEIPVRVRMTRDARQTVRGLESLGLFGQRDPATGARRSAPVSSLGGLRLTPTPGAISRRNGEQINTVQAFVKAGVLPSQVLAAALAALEREGFQLPRGYRLEVGGESSERDRAVANLLASAGVLLLLMAATLVLSFRSFRQAAVIASVGFLAIGLALAALWLFDVPFGFMAIVGTMGLIGVAINDAIVVLAAIRDDPAAAAGDPAAVRAVVVRSTRHVVATTLTTVAGFVPLLLFGGSFWRPLAVTIGGGVAGATLLALTFVPCAFLVLVRLGMRCPLRQSAPAS